MAFIIAGHHRSGTSMFREVCQTHPQVELTREMGNFYRINLTYADYRNFMFSRWWLKRNAAMRPSATTKSRHIPTEMPRNLVLVLRYLQQIKRYQRGTVTTEVIDRALHALYPRAAVVGDKLPDYGFEIDRLTREPNLKCAFIYRDPRDVAASFLFKTRAEWRRYTPDELRAPAPIAQRWLRQMELMEQRRDHLMAVRYEDFVHDPQSVLNKLGQWLGIDPAQFNPARMHANSIGKYRQGLTDQEISAVLEVAGPMMQRYGYTH